MTGKRDSEERSMHGALRGVGYAAMVSGIGAAAYTLSTMVRQRGLHGLWMWDPSAAPPQAIQRELIGFSASDESSGDESDLHERKRCRGRQSAHGSAHLREKIEERMHRAINRGDMRRVQELSQLFEPDSDMHARPSFSQESGSNDCRSRQGPHQDQLSIHRHNGFRTDSEHGGMYDRDRDGGYGGGNLGTVQSKQQLPSSQQQSGGACYSTGSAQCVGDVVRAKCPYTSQWQDATISSIKNDGLIEVRWHNPGSAPDGRLFQSQCDVSAGDIRLACRKQYAAASESISRASRGQAVGPEGLKIGDPCYAAGNFMEMQWFQAQVLEVHAADERLRVKYVSTLEGDDSALLLPAPLRTQLRYDQVSRKKPQVTPKTRKTSTARISNEGATGKPAAEEVPTKPVGSSKATDAFHSAACDDAVDDDLSCTVCGRPDDETNLLVCDCNLGYHIYCLKPALSAVPEGQWACPTCSA